MHGAVVAPGTILCPCGPPGLTCHSTEFICHVQGDTPIPECRTAQAPNCAPSRHQTDGKACCALHPDSQACQHEHATKRLMQVAAYIYFPTSMRHESFVDNCNAGMKRTALATRGVCQTPPASGHSVLRAPRMQDSPAARRQTPPPELPAAAGRPRRRYCCRPRLASAPQSQAAARTWPGL